MQPCHFLKLVNFLTFVVDQHLEQESLPLLADELMHGLVYLDPVFYCIFGSFDQTELGLIFILALVFLAEFVELLYGDALLLDALLPDSLFILV